MPKKSTPELVNVDIPVEELEVGMRLILPKPNDIFALIEVEIERVDVYPHLQKTVIFWNKWNVMHLKFGKSVPVRQEVPKKAPAKKKAKA